MKNNSPRIEISSDLRRRMTEIACEYRKAPTPSEHILWQALRGKKLDGIKFRRQQQVEPFIVDFYNSVYRLVVEVDGSIHDSQFEVDKSRQEIFEKLGLNVLMIKAEVVEKDLPSALEMIRAKIRELMSHKNVFPSPACPAGFCGILGEGQGGG